MVFTPIPASRPALPRPYPDKFAGIWQIARGGIWALKFETARILFQSDVFIAAAAAVVG